MLSNIIMGFTTALSPANLIAVLGGGGPYLVFALGRCPVCRLQWGLRY